MESQETSFDQINFNPTDFDKQLIDDQDKHDPENVAEVQDV